MADHNRYEADPNRVAIVLPGARYTPAHPLLYFTRGVLHAHGWTVQEVWWEPPALSDRAAVSGWVCDQATAALDREKAERLLLVGKSLGTFAAPVAVERDLPAIWLTPLCGERYVTGALTTATAPTLLVGGTGDPTWNGDLARSTKAEVLEIPGADHGLETEHDPVNSADILRQVVGTVDGFVARL
ncbi:alpha/beta fold hydrolase [Actinopolymorpha cephalotaxi]|nr:hypothetical protein [Actinopolymorpha cephalotaxi]NYH84854.1 pimeloyl-ACP methyl ester carboxylesterase [Actinopolymorpha cephalotaxi]